MSNIYRVSKLSDKQILSLFDAIQSEFDGFQPGYTFTRGLTVNNADDFRDDLPLNSFAISKVHGSLAENFQLQFARGTSVGDFKNHSPSKYYDEIHLVPVTARNNLPSRLGIAAIFKIDSAIQEVCQVIPIEEILEHAEPVEILNAQVQKLSELASNLIVGADKKRRELETKRDELFSEHQDQLAILEDKRIASEAKLAKEYVELEKKRDELDDREHSHVRRQLRESITTDLQTRISKPASPSRSRQFNALALLLTLGTALISGLLAYWLQLEISQFPATQKFSETGEIVSSQAATLSTLWPLYVKLFLSGATALAMVFYAITWLRKLGETETQYQQALERYMFDINRASWVIETVLDMSGKDLEEVPSAWLESVCQGLFDTKDGNSEDTSSLQALGALLNVTTEAEIGPDGPKFRLNKRAARKAASDA